MDGGRKWFCQPLKRKIRIELFIRETRREVAKLTTDEYGKFLDLSLRMPVRKALELCKAKSE